MSTMQEPHCIFCRIVGGDAPASFVHEDEDLVVFMDINPVTAGHLLVVPREHRPGLADLTPELGARMFQVGRELGAALRTTEIQAEGINLFLADGAAAFQTVFHAHLHVIPRHRGDGFRLSLDRRGIDSSRARLDAQAASISAALG